MILCRPIGVKLRYPGLCGCLRCDMTRVASKVGSVTDRGVAGYCTGGFSRRKCCKKGRDHALWAPAAKAAGTATAPTPCKRAGALGINPF
jgi:hypothetical protein